MTKGKDERAAHPLPNTLQFMRLLWAIVHGLEKASKRMTAEIGVTGPQRLVLRVVGLFPGVSAGELATILQKHPSTLTGVLQRLAAHDLLERREAPSDRRRAMFHLTAKGARVNAMRTGTVEAAIGTALTGVSAREQAVTRRVLGRLAECLEPAAQVARGEE